MLVRFKQSTKIWSIARSLFNIANSLIYQAFSGPINRGGRSMLSQPTTLHWIVAGGPRGSLAYDIER